VACLQGRRLQEPEGTGETDHDGGIDRNPERTLFTPANDLKRTLSDTDSRKKGNRVGFARRKKGQRKKKKSFRQAGVGKRGTRGQLIRGEVSK